MKNHIRLLCYFLLLLGAVPANAQTETTQALVDRYEQLLLSSPQPGSSFDRVVEWYSTQGGGLEALQLKWENASSNPEKRRAYLLLQGMLAEKMRSPAKARAFYLEALAEGRDPAQSGRLLATLETTEGNFAAAADAYRKALSAETLAPVDRMEIMRSLALLHQRAFEDDNAVAVWREAIAKFPEDAYVLEEAGEAFLTAGNFKEAREAFTKLQELGASDPFRKVAASLRLARTSELEGNADDAVRLYDLALAETSDGSWMNREVRARIEELFRRKDDLPGLLGYYEKRTAAVPQDFQALAAQANVLDDLGRGSDAVERNRAATKLAPENIELRLSLIRRLDRSGQLDAALAESEELARPADATPEALVTLGDLHWEKFEQTRDPRARENALAAWQRIAPESSTDLAQISRLAEIFGANDLTDSALTQLQRIITLSPGAVDARQKAAEIFKKRNDKTAALAVLDDLIKDDRGQPDNFLQLARLQERLEFFEQSRATGAKALSLFPQNYEVLNFVWRQAVEAKDSDQVEKIFPPLWKNSPNEFFADDAVKRYVSYVQSAGLDKDKTTALVQRFKTGAPTEAVEALVLLRMALVQQDEDSARLALEWLKKQDKPLRVLRASSEIAQAFGTPDEQIAALQQVASADPRNAQDHLKAAARIQATAGKVDDALLTVSKLIERSPADGMLYGFYAELASQAGKNEAAITRLKEGVRYVENATSLRLQLADLLQSQSQNGEAAKVLQDAFQKEEKDGRRTDIFRRQIELATQTGTLDDLIASLKEKQSKEQSGARYGAYLAEIYLQQNDLQAASEELKRSLGHNPSDPTAVARLLDLADRGGDQREGVRLAGRLAELKPTVENRASYISRLLETRDLDQANTELAKVRPDIVKDLTGWSPLLTAMRKAGLKLESDQLIAEVAAVPSATPEQRFDLGNLYLSQRNYEMAEKIFWSLVEDESLAETLAAVAVDPVNRSNYFFGEIPVFSRAMMPFAQIAQEVQGSLQQTFISQQRRGSGRNFGGTTPTAKSNLTPAQRAQARSLYVLSLLAGAQHREELFRERIRTLLARHDVPKRTRACVLSSLGDQAGLASMAREQAADPKGDPELDKFFISMAANSAPAWKEVIETLQARVANVDPAFAFSQLLSKTFTELAQQNSLNGQKLDPSAKAIFKERLDGLLQHPGLSTEPIPRLMLSNLASGIEEIEIGWRLVDETEAQVMEILQKADPAALNVVQFWQSASVGLLIQSIKQGDPSAMGRLEKLLAKRPDQAKKAAIGMARGMYFGGRSPNFLQTSPDQLIGDSTFPVSTFQMLRRGSAARSDESLQDWFSKSATTADLNTPTLGAFYADWFAGKKDEAIKRMEAVHAKAPTPRSAALLVEAYEKNNQPEKALTLIEQAELQEGETREVRSLRRLRLLRLAAHPEEARKLGEKLANSRLPSELKETLVSELNQLGVSSTRLQTSMRGTSSRSRGSSQVSDQVTKLVAAKKVDEAERIALSILNKALPQPSDQNEMNLRAQMVRSLRSMMRLGNLETALQERVTRDPKDLDAVIRLTELNLSSENPGSADRLAQAINDQPAATTGVAYILQVLRNNSNNQDAIASVISALLKTDPDNFFAAGLQLQDLRNSSAQSGNRATLLAATIDGLTAENFQKLFTPSRLSRQMEEETILGELAEASERAGKSELAISLLKKAVANAGENDATFPMSLRLTELQLAQKHTDEAADTMRRLFASKRSNFSFYGGGMSSFSNVIMNLLANSNYSGGEDQLRKLGDLAEATGTLDTLIKTFEETAPKVAGASSSLFLRTAMGRPDVAKEWRILLKSDAIPPQFHYAGMVPTVVKLLAAEPDAASLLPTFVGKLRDVQHGYGGPELALRTLVQTLPYLVRFKEDETIKKHVDSLVNTVMNDPNSPQNILYSQSYVGALNQLLENGYTTEAGKLFDKTAAARTAANYNNQTALLRIETILRSKENQSTELQFICAALPVSADKLRIRWKMGLKVASQSDSSPEMGGWEDAELPLLAKNVPAVLEIFAGPDPVSLKKVAEIPRPKSVGEVEAGITSPLGLLQARWKNAEGRMEAGPLTAYVTGENLIKNNAVPEPVNGRPNQAFRSGEKGPLGEKSAVLYAASSARSEMTLPLIDLPVEAGPQTIVFSSWLKADLSNGQMPSLNAKMFEENGKANDNGIGNGNGNLAGGQWYQFFTVWHRSKSGSTLNESIRRMQIEMQLNASSGHNSSYSMKGAWDGLQLVVLKGESPLPTNAGQFISDARTASGKKEYAKACDLLLKAFPLDPDSVCQQGTWLPETFEKANRLGELFQVLTNPALYMKNPLKGQKAAVQNVTLLSWLSEKAAASDAPPSAKPWLEVVQNAPLDETLQFTLESAVLQKEIAANPGKAQPEQLLTIMGFPAKGLNRTRVRRLWNLSSSSKPALRLLEIAERHKLEKPMLDLLQKQAVPVELLAARQLLAAWLTISEDPAKSLALWNQSLAQRQSQNSANISEEADRALIQRLARTNLNPGDLLPAMKSWMFRRGAEQQQRNFAEILHGASTSDSPRRKEYASLWVDAEFSALQNADNNSSGARVPELAEKLAADQNWKRLDDLIQMVTTNRVFKNASWQRDLARIKEASTFGQGNLESAWPVAWSGAGDRDVKKLTVHWQWSRKSIVKEEGRYDTAITLSDAPIVAQIPQQQAIEVFFGEMPSEMKLVGRAEGDSATGSLPVEVSSPNGFLRVEALVGEKRITGPNFPVVSGRRILPAEGDTLENMLSIGVRPLPPQLLTVGRDAPDGSKSIRIGVDSENGSLAYEGPAIPMQPDKFYVSRAWLRRTGNGSAAIGTVFKGKTDKGQDSSLNMILTERQESTRQWTLYSRAIPSFSQHSFWLDHATLKTMNPLLNAVAQGTEIAGWEVIEVENWKYAKWIGELALLRQNAGKTPTPEVLEKALALAAIEPLTSLDYHSDWLVPEMARIGKSAELLKLYSSALAAEPNPLFSLPKYVRVLSGLQNLMDDAATSDEVRDDAIQLALKYSSLTNIANWLRLQANYL
ncbi:MAG TPA: tetratricopeptide repeat protein, partial [Chthoniobacterales bacterium]